MAERTAPLRSILHAAAQVLRCDSVHLARLSEDRQALVLAVAATARGAPRLAEVETALGFEVSGLVVPLAWHDSAVVRALREQRLITTQDIKDITGGVLPPEQVEVIRPLIEPRLFAVVPVMGRSGPLGVMLVERAGRRAFSAEERELLVTYADRVGAELESETLADEALRLEQLGQVGAPPLPSLFLCSVGPGGPTLPDGHPLHTALGLADADLLWGAEVRRRLAAGETVTLSAAAPWSPTADGGAGPGGEPRPLRVTLRQEGGQLVCAVEDIGWSERLRREMLLAREHLSKVMHSVADAILTLDAAGVIQQSNEAARAVLGLAPAQLCGRPVQELAATERGREQLAALLVKLRRTGFAERQLRLLRRGSDGEGSGFPAQLSALLLCDENLQPAGAVMRVHDQTERRRRDAEHRRLRLRLLQTERLSALGEMAARIAHEVRNPLVSIGAAAQVVAEELPPDSPVAGEVRAIGSEVRRLDGIITEFLRFARPRRDGAAVTDVQAVLAEVLGRIRPKASGLSLRLLGHGEGQGLQAQIDPDGLRQVLWNVLLNACEASRPGGAIECAARLQPGPAGRVLLTVADEGPGIPDALRRRVFDPFFSTKARGTGLGLAICKQIVEEHGGRIRLLNRASGGARVIIELRPALAASRVHPEPGAGVPE